MNKRTVSIINELNKIEKNISLSDLAEQFEVSQRTIRNDLSVINEILRENQLPELELRGGGQICRTEKFSGILSLVSDKDYYAYKLSKQERKKIASTMLINSSEYITLSNIADNLFVSRATIINDLDDIKEYIRGGNLEVISHPNKGLRVEGKESDKRLFLMKQECSQESSNDTKNVADKYIGIQAGEKITIQKIVGEQEHFHKCFLTDDSFQKILLYLEIMVNRNQQGAYMETRRHTDNSKYLMAQDILKYISQYCRIDTTEDEVQFLSEMLLLARYIRQKEPKKESVKIQLITRQFIECISEDLAINLNSDYDFFENLSNHLGAVFSEYPAFYPDNAVIKEVLEDNKEIRNVVENNLDMLRRYVGREITEAEVDYITVHVCAAVERKKNREISFRVIVACQGEVGTSQLLKEKLKKHFNFRIIDIISSHEAKNIEEGSADFIISTVPLEGCPLECVVVSPMLNDEDYIRVGNKIDMLRNSHHLSTEIEEKELTAKGLMDQIAPVIEEYIPSEIPGLMRELGKVVRKYFSHSTESKTEIFAPYLHHLVTENHIMLDVECKDWKEAVKKSGEILLKEGYIEERYIEAMINNIELNGPYVVLSKGFAVPHEGLEKGTIKMGMSLIRLKQPVPFGAEEMDPVEFVCCLSAVDHKTHLKAFFNLVNLLRKDTFKQQLRMCKSSKEMARVIEEYEYRLEE